MSGVRASASAPWACGRLEHAEEIAAAVAAALTAASAASRTTVRIVPSTGRITAW